MGIPVETAAALGHRPVEKVIAGGGPVRLEAPCKGGWVLALVRQPH